MDMTTVITIAAIALASAANDSRETKRILEAIQTEMKDFHGRLCKIEERNNKGKNKDESE